MNLKVTTLLLAFLIAIQVHVDTTYIKVHFLYGSRPKKEFKETEDKWFGRIHGGHVGIEIDSNYIIDFGPAGKFHIFSRDNDRNSTFHNSSCNGFWRTFGADSDQVKRMTVIIPINTHQRRLLDSLAEAYTAETPYDYAFFGMRCAAAACDVLAQIGVVKKHSQFGTWRRNFYPKRFRHHLVRKAKKEGWTIVKHEGCSTRVWEND